MIKDTFYFASADKSPTEFIELFRDFYGPTMNAYDAARKSGKEQELHNKLLELAHAQNKSGECRNLHSSHVHARNRNPVNQRWF